MKFLTLVCSLLLSLSAYALECVDENGKDIGNDPDSFQALIAKKTNCWEASKLAEACAWGSSLDVSTAGTAYNVCQNEMTKFNPSQQDQDLLKTLTDRCWAKYDKMEGTLYRSMASYCALNAIQLMVSLVRPAEQE